eukprot:gene25853-biopygen9454
MNSCHILYEYPVSFHPTRTSKEDLPHNTQPPPSWQAPPTHSGREDADDDSTSHSPDQDRFPPPALR